MSHPSVSMRITLYLQIVLQIFLPFMLSQPVSAGSRPATPNTVQLQEERVYGYTLGAGETVSYVLSRHGVALSHAWSINSFLFASEAAFLAAPVGKEIYLPGAPATASRDSGKPSTPPTETPLAIQHLSAFGQQSGSDQTSDKRLQNYAQGLAQGAAGQQAEGWLNKLGGSSQVKLGGGSSSQRNFSADVLVPLYDDKGRNLAFMQLGSRRQDDRNTLNLGVGARYFSDDWMAGGNLFYDND